MSFITISTDVPLLRRSLALWHELDKRELLVTDPGSTSEGLIKMTGGLMIGLPSSEVIMGTIESIKSHNLTHEILTAAEIRTRFPAFEVSDDEIGMK